MNKENAKEFLPFVQALADGKKIQFKTNSGNWKDGVNLEFSLNPKDYRIKPEPRTFEMWLTPEGRLYPLNITPFFGWKTITVQEVLK